MAYKQHTIWLQTPPLYITRIAIANSKQPQNTVSFQKKMYYKRMFLQQMPSNKVQYLTAMPRSPYTNI